MRSTRKTFMTTGALVLVAAAVSALVLGAGGAAAGKVRTHRATTHARLVSIDANTVVGEVTGADNGKWGTQISHFTTEGNKVSGSSTAYNRHGALFGPFTLTVTPQQDGSVAVNGSAPITGGTGRYRGAHGRIRVSCTTAANDPVTHCTYRSAITY